MAGPRSPLKLLLVDGNSLVHRAYHALPPLTNSAGEATHAVFGFTMMLFKALADTKADLAVVAFDPPGPTFRHQTFTEYKANRPKMPDDLRIQFDRVHQLVEALGLKQVQVPGFEADDILGTLATRAAAAGLPTIILTGDTDALQLANDQVTIMTPRKGVSDVVMYDPAAVRQRYGLEPKQLADLRALRGDPSDNIPNIPGIGDVTASRLLQQFGSVANLFAHLDQVAPKLREKLAPYAKQAEVNAKLAQIVTDIPLDLDLTQAKVGIYDREKVKAILRELEFRSLMERLPAEKGSRGEEEQESKRQQMPADKRIEEGERGRTPADKRIEEGERGRTPADKRIEEGERGRTPADKRIEEGERGRTPADKRIGEDRKTGEAESREAEEKGSKGTVVIGTQMSLFGEDERQTTPISNLQSPGLPVSHLVATPADLVKLVATLKSAPAFAFDTETSGKEPLTSYLVGLSFAVNGHEGYYLPVGHADGPNLPLADVLAALTPVLCDPAKAKYAHNGKFDLTALAEAGVEVAGFTFDTMIAAYLLNKRALGLKDLARDELDIEMTSIHDLIGSGKNQLSMAQIPVAQVTPYAAADAAITWRLVEHFRPKLAEWDLTHLFDDVEMPLVPVLVDMERAGIMLDTDFLKKMSADLFTKLGDLEAEIHRIAGYRFNIGSTQQLAHFLFEQLKLPATKKTKTGYSTDASVLEELQGKHPVIDLIREHRELSKLQSTYVDALPLLVNERTGRVHTDFNQTVVSTGRLASNSPNLQNIPVRTEIGRAIRQAFVAAPGHWLLAADYSQVELRILAHIAHDPELLAAFRRGEDIHASTAATILNVPLDQVTPGQRRIAKAINFGLAYGMGAYGLAQRTGLSQDEANHFVETYFRRYTGVKRYIEETKAQARREGYVATLLGRRRYLPELRSQNRQLIAAAEREAINMPIQGCLPYQTRVLTSEGYRSIGKLYEQGYQGLKVWTGSRFAPFEVLNRGSCELAKLYLANGQTLQCDTRHEVLIVTEDGYEWKHYSQLNAGDRGDRICLTLAQEMEFGSNPDLHYVYTPKAHNGLPLQIETLDPTFFYWLGYYFGDGWIHHQPEKNRWNLTYSLGVAKGEERAKLETQAQECTSYFTNLGLRTNIRWQSPQKATIAIYSRGLIEFLRLIGLNTQATAATKRVPDIVFGSSLPARKAFLRGLLDADGCQGSDGATNVTLHLCQRDLLADLWLLFRTVGIEGKLRGPYQYKGYESYRLDLIGSMTGKVLGFSERSTVHVPGMYAPRFLVTAFLDVVSSAQLDDHSHKVLYSRAKRTGHLSIYALAEMLRATGTQLSVPVYAWSRLSKKLNLGVVEDTFTLAVDDPFHSFDSEGIISKNTAADIIKIAMIRLSRKLREHGLKSRMLLQVHDELILEVPEAELETVKPIVVREMEQAYPLDAPLKVDLKVGRNWGEAD